MDPARPYLALSALAILHDKADEANNQGKNQFLFPRKSELPSAWRRFQAWRRPQASGSVDTGCKTSAYRLARVRATAARTAWSTECRVAIKTSAWSAPEDWLGRVSAPGPQKDLARRFLQQLRTGDHLSLENGAWQDGAKALAGLALQYESSASDAVAAASTQGPVASLHDVARGLFNEALRSPQLLDLASNKKWVHQPGSDHQRLIPTERESLQMKFKRALFEAHRTLNCAERQRKNIGLLHVDDWKRPGWWVMTPNHEQIAGVLHKVLQEEGLQMEDAPVAPATPGPDSKRMSGAAASSPAPRTPSVLDRDAARRFELRLPPVFGGLVQNATSSMKKQAIADWLIEVQHQTLRRYGASNAIALVQQVAPATVHSEFRAPALALLTTEPEEVQANDLPRLMTQFTALVALLKDAEKNGHGLAPTEADFMRAAAGEPALPA